MNSIHKQAPASQSKKWRRLDAGGGERFTKWDAIGTTVEGYWIGTSEGKYGPVGKLLMGEAEEEVTFPLCARLKEPLGALGPYEEVRIRYLGEHPGRNGRTFKAFSVEVADDAADPSLREPEAGPELPEGRDGEEEPLPF